MRALAISSLSLLLCIAVPLSAHADTRAEAVALFDQGLREMKAGNVEKACASFKQSNQLVPDSGTKGSLAKCYDKLGRLASSWLLWRELSDTAPTADLRKAAAAQAAKLEPRVPKYVVKLAAPTPGIVVTIDGKSVNPSIELAVPVDPGSLLVRATAPGFEEWKTEQTAAEGGTVSIEIPALIAAAVVVVPPIIPVVPADAAKRRRNRHLIGGAVAGVGLGTVIVGGVFGIIASGKFSDAEQTCGGSIDQCAPNQVATAQGQVDDARGSANLSSLLVGVGGALIVTGAVLWISAPSAEQPGIAITPSSNGFVVSGQF